MKRFCPLASGSKGNSIYIETEEVKLLVDAGLSTKAIQQRLADIDVELEEIDAILISHEHTDHIRGLGVLSLRRGIPVFANSETAKAIYEHLGTCPKFKIFSTGEPFHYADLTILPFSIPHDAVDPVGFRLETATCILGICTDAGYVTSLIRHSLKGCTHLILEANHHPEMVHASRRPYSLKQRILSKTGHLSNEECGKLLRELYHTNLHHVHLAHLSEECNHPERALQVVSAIIQDINHQIEISVAPQHTVANTVVIDQEHLAASTK